MTTTWISRGIEMQTEEEQEGEEEHNLVTGQCGRETGSRH
jgi:hypothetical protein